MVYSIMAKDPHHSVLAQSDDRQTILEFEGNWYFPEDRVHMASLVVTERTYVCPYKGMCYWVDINLPDFQARNVGWVYREPKPGYEQIQNLIGFYTRETSGTFSKSD
jgi:uncharacterized protein (DUF427 family)